MMLIYWPQVLLVVLYIGIPWPLMDLRLRGWRAFAFLSGWNLLLALLLRKGGFFDGFFLAADAGVGG